MSYIISNIIDQTWAGIYKGLKGSYTPVGLKKKKKVYMTCVQVDFKFESKNMVTIFSTVKKVEETHMYTSCKGNRETK